MATLASKRKNFEESSPQKKGSKKAKQTPPENVWHVIKTLSKGASGVANGIIGYVLA